MIGANSLVLNGILDKETSSVVTTLKHFISPVYQEEYIYDVIYTNIVGSLGILILLPLLLIYLRQTATMLSEKETKVRESMSIMGMKMGYYYFTWFVRYFAVYFVMHLICAAIFVRQMPKVPFYIPFILFILFDMVLIVQNFFVQVFLSRAKIGVVIALLFFVIQYVISFLSTNSDNPTLSVNSALSIIPHAALIIAFNTLVYAESNQITPSFSGELNNYVVGYALLSFILNILFYLVLTWYLDQVVPNEWGAKKHPLFCFFSKQITQYTPEEKDRRKREEMSAPGYASTHEEIDPSLRALEEANKCIEIVALRKEFNGGEQVAV